MSSEWPLKRLSEVADFHNHRRVPLKSLDRQKRQGKYPYYGASGVVDHIDDYIFDGVFLLVSEDGENLRTRKTPIAFKTSGKFWVNNHAHILQEKEEGVLDYLEYYFSILDLTPFITGAVQPKLNKANLETIEIPVPPKDERLKINQVLNSFTNKIELNTQINQTLEQIAQALFKSWFVDFDPVKAKIAVLEAGGTAEAAELAAMGTIAAKSPEQLADMQQSQPEAYQQLAQTAALFPSAMQDSELEQIPKGWNIKALGKYVEIKRGGSPRPIKDFIVPEGYPWTKIADATANNNPFIFKTNECIKEEGLRKTIFLKHGTLILSNSATPGLPRFLDLDACIHDGWLYFPDKKKFTDTYLYFLFLANRQELVMQGNGSVFTNLKTDILRNQLVVVPPDDLIKAFDRVAACSLELIKNKSIESNKLSEVRDYVLPKILSGVL